MTQMPVQFQIGRLPADPVGLGVETGGFRRLKWDSFLFAVRRTENQTVVGKKGKSGAIGQPRTPTWLHPIPAPVGLNDNFSRVEPRLRARIVNT